MDDLWGQLPSAANTDVLPPPSMTSVIAHSPSALMEVDVEQETVIAQMIPQISQIMMWSDELCSAAWELANYVPPGIASNPDREQVWSKMLIPKMVQSLVDDVKARNQLEKSLASIVNLATAVNEGAALIRQTQGSERSLVVARQTINKRMEELNQCIETLKHLENAAIELFSSHAQEILKIVGPSAANFAQQEGECQDVIDRENRKAKELISERAAAVAKVEKFNNLVHVQSVHVHGAQAAMEQTRERQGQLNSLIKDGEQSINAVPDTVTATTVTHNRSGWWWWRRDYTTTTTSQVQNPNKQAQVDYYTGVINARNARLKEAAANEGQARNVLQDQQKELAEYQAKLKEASEELEHINARITDALTNVDKGISVQLGKIKEIRRQADATENLIGMKGSALIQCLTAIRNFSKAEKDHACLFQPLVSVLEYVKSLTESSVFMLEGDRADVFAGGVRLVKNVGFFLNTSATLRTITAPSEQHKQIVQKAKQAGRITL